jgi:very-short-patch-repair endonuclease
MAAVLAYGDRAVLSHGSAAALWGLLRPISGPVDVSVPTGAGVRGRGGVRLHRRAALANLARDSESATMVRRSIPVTALGRTIADLRRTLAPRLVRRAIRQAELFYEFDAGDLSDRTRSDLERDFLAFCRRHRLAAPAVNVELATDLRVDFLWRRARLVVETDDHRYHRGSVAFEDDHLRDLRLRRLGYAVRRYTGAQLRGSSAEIAADLSEILSDCPRPS